MASLDTNVLVRWLIDNDDPAQSETVRRLMEEAVAREEPLFLPSTVLLELEWVLRTRYGRSKPDVLQMFNALLESRELVFENEAAVERGAEPVSRRQCRFRRVSACRHRRCCRAGTDVDV
jgi:predicted nucleic-acid-binding protein